MAAVLALLLVGGLVWAGIAVAGLLGGDAAPAPAAAGSNSDASGTDASPTAAASPASTSAEPVCNPASIKVSGSTDAETYAADQNPVLSLTVTNSGDAPCPVNVGTSQMEFLISSGGDRIFSSLDCQEGAEDLEVTIEPGGSETARFTWERIRSTPECAAAGAASVPGEYVFKSRLGERTSDEVTFALQ